MLYRLYNEYSNRSSCDSRITNDRTSVQTPGVMYKTVKAKKKTLKAKQSAPGVPSITCPYIDEVIRIIKELEDAHESLRCSAIVEPLFEKRAQLATDMLEYIRSSNETLRDNSLYWYKQFNETK